MDYGAIFNLAKAQQEQRQMDILEEQHRMAAADAATKRDIEAYKAHWDAIEKQALSTKNYALADEARRNIQSADVQDSLRRAQIGETNAAAGAHSRSGYYSEVGLNPQTGKYEYFVRAGNKMVPTGVQASPKDIGTGEGRDKDPWDAPDRIVSALEGLSVKLDSKGNRVVNDTLDKPALETLRQHADKYGKQVDVIKFKKLDVNGYWPGVKDEVEVPIIHEKGSKIDPNEIIVGLMKKYPSMNRDDAIQALKSLK